MGEHPKVFISHAGEDKERFIEPFATKLREKGVDAWVSFWEILLGDSIVEKIFNEGIKNSKIFVVIISNYSITKPWVNKELNIAIVKQITEKAKIIPIILDGCKVPTALIDTNYETIKDLKNYDEGFNRIINSIFGIYEKTPLGDLPKYNRVELFFPSLSKVDDILLKICFESFIKEENPQSILDPFEIVKEAQLLELSEKEAKDSLIFLKNQGYLKANSISNGILIYPVLSVFGFQECASKLLPGYNDLIKRTAITIVNKINEDEYREIRSHILCEELGCKPQVANYIFDLFYYQGFIDVGKTAGSRYIKELKPELKRWLANI